MPPASCAMTRLLLYGGERVDGIRTIWKADPSGQRCWSLWEKCHLPEKLQRALSWLHVECAVGSNQEASTCPSTTAGQGHDWTNTSPVEISGPPKEELLLNGQARPQNIFARCLMTSTQPVSFSRWRCGCQGERCHHQS